MKKIMILGAASGQIPFIKLCRQYNAEVIVVSPKGDYPGFQYADQCYFLDTRDTPAILEAAKKEKITGIATDQTDVSVPTAAYVAERLGLPGIGYDTALRFTDKYLMRAAARDIGVAVPRFASASGLPEALAAASKMDFPLMMKPNNSSGSRGVIKIHAAEELRASLGKSLSYSADQKVIIEEFIEGREYIADGLALDHKYINTDIGIKMYFDIPGRYISKMCMFSSAALARGREELAVLETNHRLVKGLGLPFGITHAEYIYSPKNETVYLVEIAARGGGVYLSSDLTPLACGIDTNRIVIDYLLNGNTVDIASLPLRDKVSAWRCFALHPGMITKMENTDILEKIPGVYKACLEPLYIGKKIEPLIDDTRKHGPVLVYGDSREECFGALQKVEQALNIETTDAGNNRHAILW